VKHLIIATTWVLLLAATNVNAEQRALIVGVGRYVTPGIDLPGIDLDVERMHENLNRMGFSDRQIHTLTDESATSTRVIAEMDGWLRQGVQPGDRVVFYFSGHGSQVPDWNGDEDDGVDEVLVTHDMQRARKNGRATLTGVVVDDTINEMVAKNPSRNVLLIVDACHSGTVSRSFSLTNRSVTSDPVFRKSFIYDGMPEPRSSSARTRDIKPVAGSAGNYVALSAARDRESAIGTSRGGIFTIGITDTITRFSAEGRSITVNALRDEAAQFIKTKVDKADLYTPQVTGNPTLASAALKIATASATDGPNRKKLLDLVAAQSNHLDISPSKARYTLNEPVKFNLNLPTGGYLNIVTVDAKDAATVLFPNHLQESNVVKAGPFQLPTAQMAFDLLAAEPLGPTLVVAFLSSDPINFYQETLDSRDENGNITADFASLSHAATRAIRVAPRKKENWGGQVEIQIDGAAKRL
jgi:hypothetical protein